MFQPLYDKTSQNIEVIKHLLDEHQRISSVATSVSQRRDIKIFSIASSVTRLYAVYESYIETILSDYLDSIADLVVFSDLSDGFRTEYRLGISHILSRIDQGRYKHLNHEDIVNRYHTALNGGQPYQFVTDALVRHEQNLRFNIINNLFSKLGLDNFDSWSSKHPLMAVFFESDSVTKEMIENEIKTFVELRNDGSHGEIDDLIDIEIMKSYCQFIISFLEVIRQFVSKNLIDLMVDKGLIIKLGKVTESFGQNGAFILTAKKDTLISVSDKIYISSNNTFSSQYIDSIRLNDVQNETLEIIDDNLEVGLKCQTLIKNNSIIYKNC
ncbi:MAE_28990/MAE_18760 family HEPN-like nuclease [Photobacterium sp. Alg240-V54]|uniref:MAE_28990/MAE_18760 family HEPN-like nuclease n=1 Tax=Photobacterium sp. Alg240-V54 TaxID=2305995 RepID=UPI0013D33F9B|nr:MAE_28990/MAE_18760 family HEPN-like nuclease [Photobacterium sp. Alg240-V54]